MICIDSKKFAKDKNANSRINESSYATYTKKKKTFVHAGHYFVKFIEILSVSSSIAAR